MTAPKATEALGLREAAQAVRDLFTVSLDEDGRVAWIRYGRGALTEMVAILDAALSATPQPVAVPDDVRALVIAARNVAFDDTPSREALDELDKASEAFADRIPWDDEPDDEDSQQENTP